MKGNRFDALFPEILPQPLSRNPIPLESRPAPAEPIRGFPVYWPVPNMAWLPCLPAVVSYHYPVFRNMVLNPGVILVGGRFTIDPAITSHWRKVESAIEATIKHLRHRSRADLLPCPSYPSSHGYSKSFKSRKSARDAIKPSLLAFHHIIAYCSYAVASAGIPLSRKEHKTVYDDPAVASSIFRPILSRHNSDGFQTVLESLWDTLGEIHQTRNFSGLAVAYNRPYDYRLVQDMCSYGVPVFVLWSGILRIQTYRGFPGNEILGPWRPPLLSFGTLAHTAAASGSSESPATQQPPSPQPVALTPLDQGSARYPWEYVEARKVSIASVPEKPQAWVSRENNMRSFYAPGKHGPAVYQFRLEVVREGTGREPREWRRSVLSKAEARLLWIHVNPRNLW